MFGARPDIGAIAGFRYRLRIDSAGISRRRFWKWEDWPWEAFRSGQVQRGVTNSSYRWSQAGSRARTLNLEFLRWCGEDGIEAPPTTISEVAFTAAATLVGDYFIPMAERVYDAAGFGGAVQWGSDGS